jgi:hypothetical protein
VRDGTDLRKRKDPETGALMIQEVGKAAHQIPRQFVYIVLGKVRVKFTCWCRVLSDGDSNNEAYGGDGVCPTGVTSTCGDSGNLEWVGGKNSFRTQERAKMMQDILGTD